MAQAIAQTHRAVIPVCVQSLPTTNPANLSWKRTCGPPRDSVRQRRVTVHHMKLLHCLAVCQRWSWFLSAQRERSQKCCRLRCERLFPTKPEPPPRWQDSRCRLCSESSSALAVRGWAYFLGPLLLQERGEQRTSKKNTPVVACLCKTFPVFPLSFWDQSLMVKLAAQRSEFSSHPSTEFAFPLPLQFTSRWRRLRRRPLLWRWQAFYLFSLC